MKEADDWAFGDMRIRWVSAVREKCRVSYQRMKTGQFGVEFAVSSSI
ncbi:MAG: hypothetical protein ACETWD_02210 [Desulfatiglandales bacterium]